MSPAHLPADYQAAISEAVFFIQEQAGYLRLGDSDRLEFLQRQTTNDLGRLKPDQSVTTVLTSPTARILDVLTLLEEGKFLAAITLPGQAENTLTFLKSKIFIMDRVTLQDASADYLQVDLEGPRAGDLLHPFGLEKPGGVDMLSRGDFNGAALLVIGRRSLAGEGYRLLAPSEARGQVLSQFQADGVAELSQESHDALRVEAGLPASGHELTRDATPLEVGMAWAISDDKGCYTGQEIIARQITYDKVTRQLVGLHLEGPVEQGASVLKDSRVVGAVTSTVHSPRFGQIALAILRRPHHDPGTQVTVQSDGGPVTAQTVSLPFQD